MDLDKNLIHYFSKPDISFIEFFTQTFEGLKFLNLRKQKKKKTEEKISFLIILQTL